MFLIKFFGRFFLCFGYIMLFGEVGFFYMYWDFIRNLISFDVIVCVKFSFDVIIVEDKI